MMRLCLSPRAIPACVVGSELWIPLPRRLCSQVEVLLQQPLPRLGDGHGLLTQTRLLLAWAQSTIADEAPGVQEALDISDQGLESRRDYLRDTWDRFKDLIRIDTAVDLRDAVIELRPYGKETQPSRKWLKRPLFSTVDRQPTDPGCCLSFAKNSAERHLGVLMPAQPWISACHPRWVSGCFRHQLLLSRQRGILVIDYYADGRSS
jgi:hypothetical protein